MSAALWCLYLAGGFAVGVVIGNAACRRLFYHAMRDADLDYLASTGYSLQCIRGANRDDDIWAVTDGEHKMIGTPQFTPRDAITSAAAASGIDA